MRVETEASNVPQSRRRWPLVVLLACYLAVLVPVNLVFCPYPADNDLDDIGWIAAHQSLARLESFANQNYPFGYPLLLRLLTPVCGSLLRAAFVCATVAGVLNVFLVFRLAWALFASFAAAIGAAVAAAILLFPLATSEFADGLTTALLLAGILAAVTASRPGRGFLVFGLCAGAGYLFRFHFVTLLAVVPASLCLFPGGWRERGRAALAFLAGFVAGSWPLLFVNLLVYGKPLHTGYTPYVIGHFATSDMDWNDFLGTYRLWPLSRLLAERPMSLVRLAVDNVAGLLDRPEVLAAIVFVPLTAAFAGSDRRRRLTLFLATIACLYTALVMLPSRFMARAFAPVSCLIAVLCFPAIVELGGSLSRVFRPSRALPKPSTLWTWLLLAAFFLGTHNPAVPLIGKHRQLAWNRRVLDVMRQAGMGGGADVFCSFWDFYNLDDPRFITFHNYGGYMLLDRLYREQKPRPAAVTAAEWQEFFDANRIRFAVLDETPATRDFLRTCDPRRWEKIFSDGRVSVFKRVQANTG
jgi:hypothetical protein